VVSVFFSPVAFAFSLASSLSRCFCFPQTHGTTTDNASHLTATHLQEAATSWDSASFLCHG